MMMFLLLYRRETEARRGDGEDGRLSEEAERHESSGADGHSLHKEDGRRRWALLEVRHRFLVVYYVDDYYIGERLLNAQGHPGINKVCHSA